LRFNASQSTVQTKREKRRFTILKIVLLTNGLNGVDFHRLYTPFARLQQTHGVGIFLNDKQDTYGAIDWSDVDVCIFNRWMGDKQYNLWEELKANNVKVILDLDDYWVLPKHNSVYKAYKWHVKDAIKNNMLLADMVWTTTPILAEKISEFNKNVHIIPNALNLGQKQWTQKKPSNQPLTVGWVGGSSHLYDIKQLQEVMPKVHAKTGCRFIMGGHHEEQSFWQYMEKVIYGAVKRPKWFEPRTGTTPVLYGGYYSDIDVCIAPLSPFEHFNRYKSELKIVEAAAYSLPIIVSDTEPYTLHRDNEGVIFVKDNDWETAILSVLQMSKEQRQKLGQKNYDYCFRNHNLDLINEKRINLLQTLMK